MKQIIILYALLGILLACHYSCFNCTGSLYTSCISCPASPLTVVEDPNVIPQVYWSSVYPTGTCVDTLGGKANPLGIVLFIVLSAMLLVGGSKQGLYLYLTIQTWGLYNLVEIAWVNPIGYMLQAFQYFMIWNVLGSGYKSVDFTFLTNKYYRMSLYLQQPGLGQNIALIAAFTLLAMVLLIIICIIAVRRKKQAQVKQEVVFEMSGRQEVQQAPKSTCWQCISEEVLIKFAKFLLVVLFLMAQQTSLILVVSLIFNLNATAVIVSIIYLHILVFVMSYAYYYRVEYFKQKKVMYINFGKKVVLPIMVVVPIKYHYLLFLFAAATLVIEFIIDYYNGFYRKFSRLAFYKAVEILIFILLVTYYVVEYSLKTFSPSKAAAIACTFCMAFFLFLFVAVQFPIAIKQRFFSKKKQSKMQEIPNPIEQTFNDMNEKNEPLHNLQAVDVSNSKSEESDEPEKQDEQPKQDFRKTKEGSSFAKQSIQKEEKEVAQQPKPEPPPKKRRKQILDKQLRMRYGI